MAGRPRTAVSLAVRALFVVLTVPSLVRADGRIEFLAERLKFPPAARQPDDFRVRTNAALALGATDDEDAVPALCAALADPSDLVRQAVAVAMKRLARSSSLDCLRKRLAAETNAAVKTQIVHAIEAVQAGGSGGRNAGA